MKIVQVINAMIENHRKISNVLKREDEYFFLYDKKYKWSIAKNEHENQFYLHFYPTDDMDLNQLSTFTNWQSYSNFVTYKSDDIKTKEALESFSELYQIVFGKVFGIEDIFDEIINS